MKGSYWRFLFLLAFLLVVVALTPVSAQDTGSEPEGLHLPPEAANLTFNRSAPNAPGVSMTAPQLNPAQENSPQQAMPQLSNDVAHPAEQRPTSGMITALVVLDGAPALASLAPGASLSGGAALTVRSAAAAVQASQTRLASSLASVGRLTVVGSLRYTANALVVTMDASQIDAVEALPGVKQVVPDQIGYLTNAHSVPFIGAVQAWEENGGYTGTGIGIGIIDSGIDYTHVNFGGSGDLSHYTAQDTEDISDLLFDGSKVVGGYDFVGDAWAGESTLTGAGGSPLNSALVFAEGDNDPLDCNGHGSHVAGTAAGFGVDSAGDQFTGPWDSTVPFDTMRIGPGVAPEASLYALKIGGCSNAVSFVGAALALEFTIDPDGDTNPSDHLDVINNSYGGAYGTPLEIMEAQMNLVAQAGVIVIISAGNDGDTYFVNGDPSPAEWAISTAASVSDTVYAGLEITTGPGGAFPSYPAVIAASPSQGGSTDPFGPYALKLVGGTGNSQGCDVADYDGFVGEAGLIIWDATTSGCGSGTRMTNAVNHGGVSGLVVVSANPADFPFIALACTFSGGPSPIPCVSITGADGAILQADPAAFTVSFDSSLQAPLGVTIADTLASFSSRGPRMDGGSGEIILKPDLAAPGSSIVSTLVGSGNEATTESGTSMASPHVTGMAALMRQLHPTWTVPEIKALLMNTATNDLWTDPNFSGDNYGVSRIGAGRVDIVNALNSDVVAYHTAHPERVSVSFGFVEVVDTVSMTQSITVQNLGSQTETYNVSFQQMNDTPGVQFSVSPTEVTVGAGSTTTVLVTLTADKTQMANANTPDPTTPTEQTGAFGPLPRQRIMEEGGYVVLTSTGSVSTLRVPVHAVPRPSADMKADGSLTIGASDTGFAFLPLIGNGVQTGSNFPNDVISEVTALELVGEDPVTLPPELGGADIQYIGVSSDYLSQLNGCSGNTTCAINNTTIYIGISVYGEWSTLSGFESWFDIHFDSDEDETYDATVFNFETGFFVDSDFTDTIMSWVTDGQSWLLDGGNPVSAQFINELPADILETYVLNNSVIVFPVAATRIGLSAANTDFQFDVFALTSFFDGDWLPAVPPLWYTYDVAHPAYSFLDSGGVIGGPFEGISMWDDTDGNAIPVDYDVTGLTDLPGILLLHHHNAKDAEVGRAEVVQVERTSDMDGFVLKTVDNDIPAVSDNVTFTITVGNNGPGPLENPVVTDLLPLGLTYVSDTCPGASSQSSVGGGTQIICDMTGMTIPATLSLSYDIVASVDAGTEGTVLTNEATLTGFNVSATDVEPGNDLGAVNVCVDGLAGQCNLTPRVQDITDDHNVSVMNNPVVGTQIRKLNVLFNIPVRGGADVDGAANPENYRFLGEGTVPGFQTSTCTAPVSGGDQALNFLVTYNDVTHTATLDLTGSGMVPLGEGSYRVIVCGSTSILDLSGVALDGDSNGTPGDDAIVNFNVDFVNGVTTSTAEGALTAEELEGMQLPSTGETPAWRSWIGLAAAASLGAGCGWYIYRRRKTQPS